MVPAMALSRAQQALLANCDEVQREAITSTDAPILVLAGAGSGKTRVLTRRIAWRIAAGTAGASHVLALTFTRKAAAELRDRLDALGVPSPVTAGTFHAVALAQLRRLAADRHHTAPSLLDSKARLLGRIVPEAHGASAKLPRREQLSLLAAEIEWAKARLITPEAYAAERQSSRRHSVLSADYVQSAYRAYESEKRRRHLLDFDDLLVELTAEILRDPDLAAGQRWKFQHLFVDELQDANPAQIHLLDAWLGKRTDLFAVGDPRQAIYGWNGADTAAIDEFETRYPGATVLALDTNYRSTPQVVALASAALDHRGTGTPAHAVRPDGVVPTLRAYASEVAEADAIAEHIARRRGTDRPLRSFAVLARTNAQLVTVASALERLGITARTGGGGAFLDRPAVATALSELPSSANPIRFAAWLDDLAIERRSEHDQARDADASSGEVRTDLVADAELDALIRLGRDFLDLDPGARADGFLAYVREALRTEPSPTTHDAVELVTFHRAKGLEWPVVFVCGLEDGLVPIARAQTSAALAEERRLLYVALSRAEEELHCSWAKERTFGARTYRRDPSPYLSSLEETRRRLEVEQTPDVSVARRGLAESRARLEPTP
jgi:DNA helicase II / ATP-dependent DNA helicase PcrA